MYDVIIAGAGPAGSVLAHILGKQKKVLLIERRLLACPPEGNPLKGKEASEKCCGGLLDPSAQDALTALKIGVPKEVLVSPQVFSVRAIDIDNHKENYYPKRYVNIDRTAFDRMLLLRALESPGVTLLENALLMDYKQNPEKVTCKVLDRNTGRQELIEGRVLVGADGASSLVRRRLTERYLIPVGGDRLSGGPREYTCIQEAFEADEPLPYHAAIFDRYVTDFYSWIIPKNDRILVGSAIPQGADVHLKFSKLKADLIGKGFDLSRPIRTNGAKLFRPRPFGSVLPGKGKVFLCGEAAGLISPSSAEGISYALRSAAILAETLLESGKLADYDSKLGGLKREISLKSAKSPVMYGPLLRGLVFTTGALSIRVKDENYGD